MPVALVAGASSGLGRAVARRLAADGWRTYAGARAFARGEVPPEGCQAVPLDVTDGASVSDCVRRVLDAEGRIDALVNCAALLTLGSGEETSVEEIRRVLDTNFLGAVRMVQAVLPAMRAQGGGRIVQFSSLNGLFGIPFQGAYTASKHALEGWSECLAMETRPFGVQVTLVAPGDCRGGSDAYRLHARAAGLEGSPYAASYAGACARIRADESGGLPPERVARAVSRALRRRRPPARIIVAGPDQRLAAWLHDLLPGHWFYRILAAYYSPPKKEGRR